MISNFIIDDKKLDVNMLRFCRTLIIIAIELYISYCHNIVVMASRLNPSSSYNQENVTWSGLLIVDTSSIIWICLSDQLQLIRFHIVFFVDITLPSWQFSVINSRVDQVSAKFLNGISYILTGTNLSIYQTFNRRCIWNIFHLHFL